MIDRKSPDEWLALAEQAKEKADGCQVHMPAHASLLGYAQFYMLRAIFEQQRQQATFTEPVTVQGDLNIR